MTTEQSHEDLLREVLENVIRNNQQLRPGTPMAELKTAIETAINNLPPLEFKEFDEAINNNNAAHDLIMNAPGLVGWNADKIVEWIEALSKKVSS